MTPFAAFKSLKIFDFDYAYLDSGAPASSNYTTWVFVHGLGFNGAVFEKLLPLAHVNNLRIVTVNRRGYSPSSGILEGELTSIGYGKKTDEAEPFLRAQGIEIATFLTKFATEQSIPLANPNIPQGGIALIGWSLGEIHALAVLAYIEEAPPQTRSTLQKYLHTILSHDASSTALGIPYTIKSNNSLWSETDDHKRFDGFFDWATAHYIHKSVTSENTDDLELDVYSNLPHSLHELSYGQRARYRNIEPFASSDTKLLICDRSVFVELTRRALFDKASAEKFPRVRVRFMSSGTTAGALVWALWMFRKCVENSQDLVALYGSGAEIVRDIKCVTQTEGNHFIFWEDPKKAIQQFSSTMNL